MSVLKNRWLFFYTYSVRLRAYSVYDKAADPGARDLRGWISLRHISPFLSLIDFPAGLILGFLQFQCRRADILLVSSSLTTVAGTNPPLACTILPFLVMMGCFIKSSDMLSVA